MTDHLVRYFLRYQSFDSQNTKNKVSDLSGENTFHDASTGIFYKAFIRWWPNLVIDNKNDYTGSFNLAH